MAKHNRPSCFGTHFGNDNLVCRACGTETSCRNMKEFGKTRIGSRASY